MTTSHLQVSQTDKRLRWSAIILALLGLADGIYLSYIKLANATAACGGIGDCESVNNSPYSEIAGIPIAILGSGAYLAIIFLLMVEPRAQWWRDYAPIMVFGLSLTGVLYSAYLTYVEVAVLHAICPYCVISAILLVAILAISVVRLLRSDELDA